MKKRIAIIAVILLAIAGGFFSYSYFGNEDSSSLTMADREWISKNKKTLQDMSLITSIPVLNYDGKGVILDFFDDLEADTELVFNKTPYIAGNDLKTEYAITLVDKVDENQILVYKDDYVLVSKSTKQYKTPSAISNISVGILSGDLEKVSDSLKGASNITYKEYTNIDSAINAIKEDSVNVLALPRLRYLNKIVENGLTITYHMSELEQNYVLKLGKNDRLNSIIKKYYTKWYKEKFKTKFNSYLLSNYFAFAKVSDKEQSTLKSKTYKYGYLVNGPYDTGNTTGINMDILSDVKDSINIKVEVNRFDSLGALYESFNTNNIDLYFDTTHYKEYEIDTYDTVSYVNNNINIITSYNNLDNITSLASLKGYEVYTIKDSLISQYLVDNKITTKEFNNIEELVKNIQEKSVVAIDNISYDYYSHKGLENTKVNFVIDLENDYNFIIRDVSANKVFAHFLNFYLSFTNTNTYINNTYSEFLKPENSSNILFNILAIIGIVIALLFIIYILYNLIYNHFKNNNRKEQASKIRYIDMLTALKNRNYLNEHIDEWDDSETYPKAVVVVDLNNVAYINDNYGHQEGDNVIKEAANILIKTQIDNSDLIRTSGNEFLVYLVGHDEKEVTSYIKKLNKEFKSIAHGFGAAVGYSMILDGIKTIDDAVNEATIDMRNNKNNVNNNE